MEYDNILHKLSTNKEIKIRHSLEYQIIEQTMKTLVQFKKKRNLPRLKLCLFWNQTNFQRLKYMADKVETENWSEKKKRG